VVLASATFGVVKYKDEIVANVSKVFKGSKIEVPNVDSTEGDEQVKEPELVEEPTTETTTVEELKKEVENLKKQITENKKENFQPITSQIAKSTPAQETTATTPSPEPVSSIRYIKDTSYKYIMTGEHAYTNTGKTLFKGTQVMFISGGDLMSKIEVDGQEVWVFSSDLVSDEPATPKLSGIIEKWRPIVAYVECDFRDLNTNQLYSQVRGSGVVVDFDTQITVITNRHVIVDSNGFQPHTCRIKLPNDNNTFIGQKFTGGSIDIGLIDINNPNEYIRNLTSISNSPLRYCKQKPSLGDDVLILGYPSIGSQTDITATEGIISGYDGDYFITSAKVEQGNSGGAAILVRGDCYLGIPSFAKTGSIESLSRILDINAVF